MLKLNSMVRAEMTSLSTEGRRFFLKQTAVMGFRISLCFVPGAYAKGQGSRVSFSPSIWLSIKNNGRIDVVLSRAEMGQGILSSVAMLVADELEVKLDRIDIRLADASKKYGRMLTAGSASMRQLWMPIRVAAASTREILVSAAALKWGVPQSICRAESGFVVNEVTAQRVSYVSLLSSARKLTVPQAPKLKSKENYNYIGHSIKRLDNKDKVTGRAVYGIDIHLPNMLYAAIRHAPVFGASVASYQVDQLSAQHDRMIINLGNAVAAVADSYWEASKLVNSLQIKWKNEDRKSLNDRQIKSRYARLAQEEGAVYLDQGAAEDCKTNVEAEFTVARQAHVTMEPMSCSVHIKEDVCEIWAPTQNPNGAKRSAESIFHSSYVEKLMRKLGVSNKKVVLHPTLMGGGFGRRLKVDYIEQAVKIAIKFDRPIKLIWSREEDLQHDFYRPYTHHKLQACLKDGKIQSWLHRVVSTSKNDARGGLTPEPYAIPRILLDYHTEKTGVPSGAWRSVGHSHNVFATECFLDILANQLEEDPYSLRLSLLAEHPSHVALLNKLVELSSWSTKAQDKRHLGMAFHEGFGSAIAMVAELEEGATGVIFVKHMYCVVDCGQVVNPDIVKSQIQGGIIFAMSAAIKGEISIENGQVQQSNFHDYPIIKANEVPSITVALIGTSLNPGGVGEIAVPVTAPAIANAFYSMKSEAELNLPIKM